MKDIVLIVLILQGVVAVNSLTYYITPGSYSGSNGREEVFLQWSTIQHNISTYFTSHTNIKILNGTYEVNESMLIADVQHFSITGEPSVTIKCLSDSAVFVKSSEFVKIQNLKFSNCGMGLASAVSAFSHNFSATVSLHNVQSVVLSNITFENSLGHGIVGINVLGSSALVNIIVYHNNNLSGNSLTPIGGIILVYVDTIDDGHHNQIQSENNVLINNCRICCMNERLNFDLKSIAKVNGSFNSSILSLLFYQQLFSVNVEILNFTITKIAVQTSALVCVVYYSSMPNSVTIENSKFVQIKSTNYPIVFVTATSIKWQIAHLSTAYLQVKSCIFHANTGGLTKFIKENKNAHLVVLLEITTTVFSYNEAAESYWVLPTREETALITIVNCRFVSNTGLKINIKGIHNVTLSDTLFYNNSFPSSVKMQSLFILDKTVTIFEGYNEFSFNTVDVIISLSSWIYLRGEGTTLNISNNKAISMKSTKPNTLIHFKANLDNYPCIIQFLSMKGNSHENSINNNTINFSVIFNNNHNYTSILYGTVINSCYWKKDNFFHNSTPGEVYKRVIHFDTSTDIIAGSQAKFCYCDNVTKFDCFKDSFTTTPIYPGQKIAINLVRVPYCAGITPTAVYLWHNTAAPARSQHNSEPCQLASYQPTKCLQFMHESCVPLFYRVLTNSSMPCSACFSATSFNTYCFNIGFRNSCPPGFEHEDGACKCNRHLKAAF